MFETTIYSIPKFIMLYNNNYHLYLFIAILLLVTVETKSVIPTIVFVPFFSSDHTKTMLHLADSYSAISEMYISIYS